MSILLNEHQQWLDGSVPIVNGLVFVGTNGNDPTVGYPDAPTNLITIYSDRALTTPITNPQATDADGRTVNKVWIPDVTYSVVVRDSDGVQKYISLDEGKKVDELTIANVAELITTPGSYDGQFANLAGYYATGDGGQGRPYWDATSTETPDNGMIFQVTGVTTGRWKRPLMDSVSPYHFGGNGDGITGDSAFVLAASVAAVANKLPVSFSGGTWLFDQSIALTSAHNDLIWDLDGGKILKGFSGNLCTVASTQNFSLKGKGTIDGQQTSYTGKGFVFSGSSHYPTISKEIKSLNFPDAFIEFGPDAGFRAKTNPTIRNDTTEVAAVRVTGPDTTAMDRDFSGVSANGNIELTGALATTIVGGYVTRVIISSTCSITLVSGVVWGSGGTPVAIDGTITSIIGCRIASAVTLNSGMSGSYIGNVQTTGTFTDNSITGNVLIHHHPLGKAYEHLGKSKYSLGQAGEFQINHIIGLSDADVTWTPDSSPSLLRLAANLTANRAVTLTTTNSRSGMQVRIARPGGDTGGPWNLTIGSTGKVLTTKTWCDVFYNGSYWEVIAYGALP